MRRSRRLHRGLVWSEIALSIVPLIAAGLMLRTFANLVQAPIGFDPAHVVTARVPLNLQAFPTIEQRSAFYRNAIARVAELPGVEAASIGGPVPLAPVQTTQRFSRSDDRDIASIGIQQSVNESCGYELSVYGNPASIIWLPGGETTPTITVSPAETTTYGAIVDGGNGCSYQIGTVVAGNRLQLPTCLAPSVASVDPGTAAASGGTPITVSGEKFQPGAALFIGGAAAGNVVVVDAQQITADAPAL